MRDPSSRPHEVSDDLESFFWVLLYLVAKCRNVRAMDLVEEMQEVFDQHKNMDRPGMVTGGKGKLACLRGTSLDQARLDDLVQTPCKDIIEEFRMLFRDFYVHVPMATDSSLKTKLTYEAKREQDPLFKIAREKIFSSRWILDMMDGHLARDWNVDDDSSLHMTVLHPDSVASRNPLKRKASDSRDDEDEDSNQRRNGRPRSTPANSRWSRGSLPRDPRIRTGPATGASSSRGDSGVSSRSAPARSSRLGSMSIVE